MGKYGKKLMERLVKSESSPGKLAWSIALGIFLAFSPYLGFQTLLVFVLSFLFRANAAVVFIILYTVNNPWTMVPIIALDYVFGHWLLESLLGLDLLQYNPSWMDWINKKIGYLTSYLGVEHLCFWCFFIGGNIIAISCAFISYPFLKRLSTKIIKKYSKPDEIPVIEGK
jgi:uncharacterized protein (DUF2062 family)